MSDMAKPPLITFRSVGSKDLTRLNEIVNHPQVARFLNLIPPVSMKSTVEFYEQCKKGNALLYAIIVNGILAGSVCLTPRKKDGKQAHVAEFGISIDRECWGMGAGAKAIDRIISEGRKRGIKRVEFEVVAGNTRALRLYRRKGFKEEGVKEKSFKINGRYHDTLVMAMLL
ncbi:MAG: GNAT family protein [Candidatus Altiarchaeota archaeon]|nr:GNAT family protein [Candidatus Altiarchaeota archaeon]